jgi:hypothetical protein
VVCENSRSPPLERRSDEFGRRALGTTIGQQPTKKLL